MQGQTRATARQQGHFGKTLFDQVQQHEEALHQARRERLLLPADPLKALHMAHAPGIKLQLLALLETHAVQSISGSSFDTEEGSADRGIGVIARRLTQTALSKSTLGNNANQITTAGSVITTVSPSKLAKSPKGNPYIIHRYMKMCKHMIFQCFFMSACVLNVCFCVYYFLLCVSHNTY